MKCTHCGADVTGSVCEFCGSELSLEDVKKNVKITLMDKGMDVVKMVTEGCAAEKNLLAKAYDNAVNPKVDKKKLYITCGVTFAIIALIYILTGGAV